MILVLGSSGYIGNYLYQRFREESWDIMGTYCHNKNDGMLHFDMENMEIDETKLDIDKVKYVILSAAVNATIDESKKQWERSYNVNVVKMKKVINYFLNNNIVPIYISTDNVFGGAKGKYSETDERNPINSYGQIRYEIEDYLTETGSRFVVLRMGKVFGSEIDDGTLITSILKAMREGQKITCAEDQFLTPLYIEDLFDSIRTLIDNEFYGVFHLTSLKKTTRYEIAKSVKKYFGLNDVEIITCKINSLGLLEKRPLLTDLDDYKFRKMTGAKCKDIDYYLGLI
jgi:dTDP-4-dehydrorhamnose reductase